MKLRYEIPQGFSDEIKWFKFFSMRSLIVLLGTAAPGVLFIRLFGSAGITLYLIVFWVLVTGCVTACTMFRLPASRWVSGGGEYIDQILIKRLIRKRKRCLYIRGYAQLSCEEKEDGDGISV